MQEFLQEHNKSASPKQSLPASLWHEWREREPPSAEALEDPAEAGAADPGPGWLADSTSGLFGDSAEDSKAGFCLPAGARHAEDRRDSKAEAIPRAASSASAALAPALSPAAHDSAVAVSHPTACHGTDICEHAAASARPAHAQHADAPGSSLREALAGAASGDEQGSRQREEGSRSMVGSLLSAVGRSVAAWMPPILRRALDGRSERGSESDGGADGEDAPARDQVRGEQESMLRHSARCSGAPVL